MLDRNGILKDQSFFLIPVHSRFFSRLIFSSGKEYVRLHIETAIT